MSPIRPFTPTREDPALLDRRTVGLDAGATLDRIVGRVKAALDGNLAHTLVIGPRGAGKTHVLAVARHRVGRLFDASAVRSVAIPEDGHGIVTYVELLRFVARSLGVDLHALGPDSRDVGRLESAVAEQLDDAVLVLVVENLHRLFAKLGVPGQHDLRAWVESSRKVLILASSPLLFEGVRDRDQPWFGSFTPEFLADLTAEEGSQLLENLRPTDTELADFLATPAGRARIEAMHHLTGGSPRLWTILADVVTVQQLDELVPAVEQLLEGLVTYYQERLWGLGPNEERVVTALAFGPASRTATELADELGLDQRTIGTTMTQLADARIVRGRKIPGTDQRSTWYELSEPLMRHYLQYRTDDRRELTLIVEMVRRWFDPKARERHLLDAPPGSEAERYLGASLNIDRPVGYDDAYEANSEEQLLLQARRWINDPGAEPRFRDAGLVLEAVLGELGVGTGGRPLDEALRAVVDVAVGVLQQETEPTVADALDALATPGSGALAPLFRWLAASWRIPTDPDSAERLLAALRAEFEDGDDLLAVHVSHELAFVRGLSDPAGAIASLHDVLERRQRLQGPLHPDVLVARSNIAALTGASGDLSGALELSRALLPDQTAALGPDHPDTLRTRSEIAFVVGESGDWAEAVALYQELLPDQTAALGSFHPDTLSTRSRMAYFTAKMDPAAGLDLYRELLPDQTAALGGHHRGTLVTRSQIAFCTGATGHPEAALALYRELLPDRVAALGPRHRDTLRVRMQIAYYTGQTGDSAGALALYRELLPEQETALGPTDRHTLTTRAQIVYFTAETGDSAGALALHRELLADRLAALGPNDPETLGSRAEIAYLTGANGDGADALALFRQLLPDQAAALGPSHRDTLTTRGHIAYYTGKTGDRAGALGLYRDLLADRAAALGPTDPDTLLTEYQIGALELALGHPVEALVTAWHLVEKTRGRWPNPELGNNVLVLVGVSIAETLLKGLTSAIPEDMRRGGLKLIVEAAEGSEKALAQLPAEIRDIVKAAAGQNDAETDRPG